jgi:asparaginyl-tRNA synthetase|tara:strand:- start:1171 stop:2577 length:1407 start_codon:yes stop_codon:yes gene_type:complete
MRMIQAPIQKLLEGEFATGKKVMIQGWVKTKRDSKAGISFVQIHDGSCFDSLQLVVPDSLDNYASEVLKITTGCAVEAQGTLVESQGKGQRLEVQADAIKVVGWVENPDHYPLQPKRHSYEYLREVAHLRPRSNTISACTRVRHCAAQAIHRYFSEQGFYWIHTPIITASDCEGAGDMFRVSALDMQNLPRDSKGGVDYDKDFFGTEAFLTVSGQLNVEAFCLAMTKVYTFGPTFRAENSNTSRHLAEFWMVEPEIAFADLGANAELAESLLKSVFRAVLDERQDDMAFFAQRVDEECIARMENAIESKFESINYTDAVDVLKQSGRKFEYPVEWGLNLQSEHERFLAEEYFSTPVTVTNYPKEIKGFYMRLNDDGKTVAAMDVLMPGIGEIIGGSQREERLAVLDQRMDEAELPKEHYWWYRDLRRYGTVPHAGFGLGFERLMLYITGLANVRDVIPFPRVPNNAQF